LVGSLYIEGDLRVVGTVDGELEVTGSLEIDDGGTVTGPVIARDRLVVGRAGTLKGDVRVARLVVQDGATFSGKVSMGKTAVEAPPTPATPAVEAEKVVVPEAIKPPEAMKPPVPAKPPQPVKSIQAVKLPQPPRPPQTKGKRR
jgi:cytoskeletal protein CcmA (bactofilin family)